MSIHMSVFMFIHTFIHMFIHMFMHMLMHIPEDMSIHIFIHISVTSEDLAATSQSVFEYAALTIVQKMVITGPKASAIVLTGGIVS